MYLNYLMIKFKQNFEMLWLKNYKHVYMKKKQIKANKYSIFLVHTTFIQDIQPN